MQDVVGEETVSHAARSPVLRRAADILNAFDDSHLVLSLHELSERTELPKSTAHRFVQQLLALGWLEAAVGGYRIGLRLFEVGGLVERRNRLRDGALPHMHRIAERCRCVVHLGILDASDVVCIEKVPVREVEAPTRQGGRMPVHCTAMGKAMLAFAGGDEIERAIRRGLPKRTTHTIVDAEEFRTELATVRQDGVAFDRDENIRGYSCVGVPIRNSGRAVGALSITGRSDAFDFRATANEVRRAAQDIWLELFPAR